MPKKICLIIVIILTFSCSKKGKVYLIKQWHLSPSENTLDIELSKSNPKYNNQIDIYKKVQSLISNGSEVVIAEGCEEEATYLKEKFNGWNFETLKIKNQLVGLESILAPVPLKIKATLKEKIKLVCGDNEKLLKKNSLVFSDLRGYVNFFRRLVKYRDSNPEKFKKYEVALREVVSFAKDEDPILIAKNKALAALDEFERIMESRNDYFVKKIAKYYRHNPILVVGGLHIKGIQNQLTEQNIEFEVITPQDYPLEEDRIINDMKSILHRYKTNNQSKLILYQVPEKFKMKNFPIKNIIPENKLASVTYLSQLKALSLKHRFPFSLLQSDYDKDGIRDFTLSTSKGMTVLSSEDNDWDNDGIPNLVDESIGNKKEYVISKNSGELSNFFNLEGPFSAKEEVIKLNSRGITLLNYDELHHDILILKVLNEILAKTDLPKDTFLFLKVSKPRFTYGKKSFFSYNKQAKVLDIFVEELFNYLLEKKKNEYRYVKTKDFVNGVVIPILIHSLSHEIGHMQKVDIEKIAKKNGWNWYEENLSSIYLSHNRLKEKVIKKRISKLKYKDKTYSEYLAEHRVYLQEINKLLNRELSDLEYKSLVKKKNWYIPNKSLKKQLQTSFLLSLRVPSLYSLSSLSEWYAENFASCLFRKFYPKTSSKTESIRFEVLVGFNPYKMSPISTFCQ